MSSEKFRERPKLGPLLSGSKLQWSENLQDCFIDGIIEKDKGLQGAGSTCEDLLWCKQLK